LEGREKHSPLRAAHKLDTCFYYSHRVPARPAPCSAIKKEESQGDFIFEYWYRRDRCSDSQMLWKEGTPQRTIGRRGTGLTLIRNARLDSSSSDQKGAALVHYF